MSGLATKDSSRPRMMHPGYLNQKCLSRGSGIKIATKLHALVSPKYPPPQKKNKTESNDKRKSPEQQLTFGELMLDDSLGFPIG